MPENDRPSTPRGFRDILYQEAAERRVLAGAMRDISASWGYREVETPVLERAETLALGVGQQVEGASFRLFDLDGGLLALRPEMTVPIARLVATRFEDDEGVKRLSYVSDVFREHAAGRGEYRQFTQFGVELVGPAGPAADAETIAVMVEALRATGLAEFEVAVGTVTALEALLDTADVSGAWRAELMGFLHDRNLVGLDTFVRESELGDALARALTELPRIRGGREAIDRARDLLAGVGRAEALDGFAAMWDLLEAAAVADRVAADFGTLRSFDYYTGIVFEAYTPRLGLALGGGGRYDSLLARFGAESPAAGFALGVERVHLAMSAQGIVIETPQVELSESARALRAAAGDAS